MMKTCGATEVFKPTSYKSNSIFSSKTEIGKITLQLKLWLLFKFMLVTKDVEGCNQPCPWLVSSISWFNQRNKANDNYLQFKLLNFNMKEIFRLSHCFRHVYNHGNITCDWEYKLNMLPFSVYCWVDFILFQTNSLFVSYLTHCIV